MLDERKVRIYAWFVREGLKTIEEIPIEYQQAVTDYNASFSMSS